jgi:hypothetical protein
LASGGAKGPDDEGGGRGRVPEPNAQALRDRIRRAGSVRPPAPANGLATAERLSSAPPPSPVDTSGVHTLPPGARAASSAPPAPFGAQLPRTHSTLLGMPALSGVESPLSNAETARTQLLPRVDPAVAPSAVDPVAATASGPDGVESGVPRSRRPPPHPASVRPPQRTSGGRYAISPGDEEVLVAPSRSSSRPISAPMVPPPAAAGEPNLRRVRHRQATPAQRPHARRSSPPPVAPEPRRSGAPARPAASAPPPPMPPAGRASAPSVPSASASASASARTSTPPPVPGARTSPPPHGPVPQARSEGVPPRVPRPVPVTGDIPTPSRPAFVPAPLPSVVLDPELEARAERRSSVPPAPNVSRARLGADAETALIPRALLDGPEDTRRSSPGLRASQQAWLGLLTVGAVAAALVTLAAHLKQQDAAQTTPSALLAPASASASPPAVSERPSGATRRIRVESTPAGAHVVSRGAVIGITPTDVPAPASEELFLLRLPGHQTQLLQLSPSSDPRIVVVMQQEAARAANDAPAKAAQ